MTGKTTTETTEKAAANTPPVEKPKPNAPPVQQARVGYCVEAQMIFPRPRNENEKAEEYQAYREAYEMNQLQCTVVKHVRWPNGESDMDTYTLAECCKYKQVREWQKDSAAAAASLGQ